MTTAVIGRDSAGATVPSVGTYVSFALATGSVACAAVFGSVTSDPAPAVLHTLLLVAGIVTFRRRGMNYFLLAYALNTLAVVVFTTQFLITTGEPFAIRDQGDDALLFEASKALGIAIGEGRWHEVLDYSNWSGFGFVVFGALLHYALAIFGDYSPLAIRAINAFIGATIAPAVWLLGRLLFSDHDRPVAAWAALITACFPVLTYYASSGVRDIWLAAITVWMLYAVARYHRGHGGVWTGWLMPAVGLFVIFTVRPFSAFLMGLAWFALVFLEPRGTFLWAKRLALGTFVAATILFAWVVAHGTFAYEMAKYAEVAMHQAAPSSLGVRMMALPSPLNEVGRSLHALVAPVPPLQALRPDAVWTALGVVAWYFAIPLLVVAGTHAFRRKDRFFQAFLLLLVAAVVAIGLTSGDLRHKLPLYPIGVLYSVWGAYALGRHGTLRIFAGYGLAVGALVVVYLWLKWAVN